MPTCDANVHHDRPRFKARHARMTPSYDAPVSNALESREGAVPLYTLTVVLRASHPRLRGESRHRRKEGGVISHRGRTSRPMVPPCLSDVPAFYPERPVPSTVITTSLHHSLVKKRTHPSIASNVWYENSPMAHLCVYEYVSSVSQHQLQQRLR